MDAGTDTLRCLTNDPGSKNSGIGKIGLAVGGMDKAGAVTRGIFLSNCHLSRL